MPKKLLTGSRRGSAIPTTLAAEIVEMTHQSWEDTQPKNPANLCLIWRQVISMTTISSTNKNLKQIMKSTKCTRS